jgi:hypothetical protein
MKRSLLPALVCLLFGCTAAAPVSQQKMLLLADGRFQVGGVTSDFAGALVRLGPPETTQVNLTGCSSIRLPTVQKAKEALANAGYSRVGFAQAKGADLALCGNAP